MSNVIIIEPDKKIAFQISKLFEEMSQEHKVYSFEDLKTFESVLFDQEQKSKTPFPCPTVEVLFFNASLLESSELQAWCKKVYSRLVQTKKHNPEKAPHDSIHFVAGTYESDGLSKFDLMIPYIKDIIYYPIDRLLFMQKMEVLLALPKKVTPSYLFSEKVDLPIEISKRAETLKINEIGFQIENPVQLTKGTTAHFYLHIDKNTVIDSYARVSSYRPSSKSADRFIVSFIFEGLSELNQKNLRLFLAKKNIGSVLINDSDSDYMLNPLDMFAKPNEKIAKDIALIVENEAVGHRLKEIIEKSLSPVRVIYESSLHDFHKKHLNINRVQPAIQGEDITTPKLSFVLNSEDKSFKNFIGQIQPTDQITNEPIEMLFSSEDGWTQILNVDDSRDEFFKKINSLQSEVQKTFLISLGLNEDTKRLFQITLFLNAAKQSIQVHIEPPDVEKLANESNYISKLDLMILDENNSPDNFGSWKNQINNFLNTHNMLRKANTYLKVVNLVEKVSNKHFKLLKAKHIQSLHTKAMNNNQLLMSIADLLKLKHTKYNWENTQWIEQKLPLHIATPSHLESLSEFGAFIKHSRPIAPGTFLFLHNAIFDQAPNKSLGVRFYYTEEDPSDKESHLSYFTYFGINDQFLKFVRSWIRENYASKKNL